MEGYSVTEAASILGVPTERVWELLARGVLSGAPDGDTGMRVYLQPRPAPAPPAAEPGRPNGDGGPAEPRELSPFRELLTEFRNLTERYGQALLALGEARGEVAALRSRVDLLEARMDLRLPMAPAASADPGWGSGQMERAAITPAPAPARPDREPPATVPHADEPEAPEDELDRPSARRRSSQRRATEGFAEALARADDPTRPELPGAAETAAAMAALRDHEVAEAQETQAEAAFPRELPVADSIPSGDEVPPTPDRAPSADAPPEPVPVESMAGPDQAAEPEPPIAVVAEPVEDASNEGAADPVVLVPEPDSVVEPEIAKAAPVKLAEADAAGADGSQVDSTEPTPASEDVVVAPPIDWDPDRYTVAIEEPDWFAGEVSAAVDELPPEPEEPGAIVTQPEPEPEPEPEPLSDEAEKVTATEETMLWFGREMPTPAVAAASSDDGADEMEVAGGRMAEARPMPGSRELDDALAALDALARGNERPAPPEPEPAPQPAPEVVAPPPSSSRPSTDAAAERAADPWIPQGPAPERASVTPASRAYRRLRRIFPG